MTRDAVVSPPGIYTSHQKNTFQKSNMWKEDDRIWYVRHALRITCS